MSKDLTCNREARDRATLAPVGVKQHMITHDPGLQMCSVRVILLDTQGIQHVPLYVPYLLLVLLALQL